MIDEGPDVKIDAEYMRKQKERKRFYITFVRICSLAGFARRISRVSTVYKKRNKPVSKIQQGDIKNDHIRRTANDDSDRSKNRIALSISKGLVHGRSKQREAEPSTGPKERHRCQS